MNVRNRFNYDYRAASDDSALDTGTETPTQQSFKDECDINAIMKRFGVSGVLPATSREPLSGDFSNVGSYQDIQNLLIAAQDAFYELPADIRKEFGNDAMVYADFVSDEANRPKAEQMGLVPKKRQVNDSFDEGKTVVPRGDPAPAGGSSPQPSNPVDSSA